MVASDERLRQWNQTEQFLLKAKTLLPSAAQVASTEDLALVDKFLQNNELGLAADWLGSIVREFDVTSVESMKFIALAEASMGRLQKQAALDALLSKLMGSAYETVLRSAA